MDGSKLRAKIQSGERIYGTMTSLVRNPRWASVFGRLAFDYVIVDTEHAPTGRSEAADLAFALHAAGVCPILRVKDSEPHATVMALDAGFHGVLVPYCETPEEVRAAVWAARSRPLKGILHDRARDQGEYFLEGLRWLGWLPLAALFLWVREQLVARAHRLARG